MAYSEFGGSRGRSFGETVIIDDLLQQTEAGYAKGPERTLMAALLFDGLQAYMSFICATSKSGQDRYKEAFNWVNCRENDYIFSFENVCEGLGIDSNYLRIGLANAANQQVLDRKRARRHF